VEFVAAISAN
jgi:hypothetical protein